MMVIIVKNENKKDFNHYRPTCLLSNIYKLLTKVLTKWLEKNQPRDQARFKSRYSAIYHIHVVNQLKEKRREYSIPFCITFVDYEEAFDSVLTQIVLMRTISLA